MNENLKNKRNLLNKIRNKILKNFRNSLKKSIKIVENNEITNKFPSNNN